MARKSKEALFCERLKGCSNTPLDLLRLDTEREYLFSLVRRAEAAEPAALEEITLLLFRLYEADRKPSEALCYFANIGISHGVLSVARLFLRYALVLTDALPLAISASDVLLCSEPSSAELISLRERLLILDALDAASRGEDRRELLSADMTAEREYIASLLGLNCTETQRSTDELLSLCERYTLVKWQEHWLRLAFTRLEKDEGELVRLAPYALKLLSLRRRPGDIAAEYAWLYLLEKEGVISEEGRTRLSVLLYECVLGALCDPEPIYRDLLYRSLLCAKSPPLGVGCAEVKYEKNRYCAAARITGHTKRSNRHFWHLSLAIPKSLIQQLPTVSHIELECVNHDVARYGRLLATDGSLSQLIIRAELLFSGKTHPFTLDLVSDLSFVSAAKCSRCDFKLESVIEEDDQRIFHGGLYVY